MKKSGLVIFFCLALLISILVGCGGPAATTTTSTTSTSTTQAPVTTSTATTTQAAANIINLKIAGGLNQGHPASQTVLRWKDKVEKATNGRVKVTFYEAGTMGKSTELYDEALNGVVEAVHTAEFWAGGRFPLVEGANSLPFTYSSINQVEALDQTLFDRGLLKELEPFKLLYFTPVAVINLFSKEKIDTMEKFAGQKIRASGNNAKLVELLGGTGLAIPGEEEYMALDRGTLTGNLTGADNVVSRKEYEVMKFAVQTPISMGGFIFIMNKNFWNSLPKDIQTAIDNVNKEERSAHLASQNAAIESSWTTLKEKMTVFSLTADEATRWQQKVSPLKDTWIQTMKDKGLPVDDVMKVVKEITGK